MNKAYTDKELIPFFNEISAGFTVDDAAKNIGYCSKRLNSSLNDVEVRSYIVSLSMHSSARKTK